MKYSFIYVTIAALFLIGAGCTKSNNPNSAVPSMAADTAVTNSERSIQFICPTGWSCGDDEFGTPVVFHKELSGAEILFDEIAANDLMDAIANRKIDLSYYPETSITDEGFLPTGSAYLLLQTKDSPSTSYDIITQIGERFILCKAVVPTKEFSDNKSDVEKLCTSVENLE